MGMWLSILYGAAVMVPLIWSKPILLALGQAPDTAALAAQYLAIVAFGMIPALLVMVLKNYLAALERAQPVLWITVGAALLNALTNYALIFGNLGAPELGIAGAGIATIVVQIASLLAVMLYTVACHPGTRHVPAGLAPRPRGVRAGVPPGLADRPDQPCRKRSVLGLGADDGLAGGTDAGRPRHRAATGLDDLRRASGPQPGGHGTRGPRRRPQGPRRRCRWWPRPPSRCRRRSRR